MYRICVRIHLRTTSASTLLRSYVKVENSLFLTFAYFALAVKVPDRLGQRLDDIRSLFLQNIVDMVYGGYIALPTLQCAVDAQQAHDIASVGVEELSRVRSINPHSVNLRRIVAEILRDFSAHLHTGAANHDGEETVCSPAHDPEYAPSRSD